MDNQQNNNQNYGVTTNEIMDFLKEHMVMKEEFVPVKTDVSALKTDVSALKTDVSALKTDVSELRQDMMKMKLDLIDAMDDKLADLKGDIVMLTRKEDKKVVSLIGLLKQKQVISENEAKALLTLEPFPQLFV
ncbi:MAG: hypothetical protein HY982_02505 [Candidatus Magasanikbacteria bacterium]|nr:hypothetical protein [Candidatus Magasanikbacteria bacterium]